MALKTYRCMNVGNCATADTRKLFELPDLGTPACPECGLTMVHPIKGPRRLGRPLVAAMVLGAIALTAGVGYVTWRDKQAADRLDASVAALRAQLAPTVVDAEPYVGRLAQKLEEGEDPDTSIAQLIAEVEQRAQTAVEDAGLGRFIQGVYREASLSTADAALGDLIIGLETRSGIRAGVFEREADPLRARQLQIASMTHGAMASVKRGDFAAAAGGFEKAVADDPGNAWTLANLCGVYAQLGRLDDATGACDSAIRLDPANWLAHYNRGCVEALRGQRAAAVADLARALEFLPQDPAKLVSRAALIQQMQRDPTLANVRTETSFKKLVTGASN